MTFSPSFGRIFSPSFKPNSLADAVVAGGWWLSGGISAADCLIAYQPKGAADYAASKVNLANPGTYNATESTSTIAWTTETGWDNTATGRYMKTGFSDWLREYSLIIKFSDIASGTYLLGDNDNCLYIRTGGRVANYGEGANKSSTFIAITDFTSGVMAISDRTAYKDKVAYGSALQESANDLTAEIFLFGGYLGGSYVVLGKIQAFALYKITLTGTQVGLLGTAMNAL